jgi:hypothetical protein
VSAAVTGHAAGNALDHQPGFIGPQWDIYKRWKDLRDLERVRCVMVVDGLLEKGLPSDDWILKLDLDAVVHIRALLARLDEYEKFHSDYMRRWREAADAAGADLTTFTMPVEAAA